MHLYSTLIYNAINASIIENNWYNLEKIIFRKLIILLYYWYSHCFSSINILIFIYSKINDIVLCTVLSIGYFSGRLNDFYFSNVLKSIENCRINSIYVINYCFYMVCGSTYWSVCNNLVPSLTYALWLCMLCCRRSPQKIINLRMG